MFLIAKGRVLVVERHNTTVPGEPPRLCSLDSQSDLSVQRHITAAQGEPPPLQSLNSQSDSEGQLDHLDRSMPTGCSLASTSKGEKSTTKSEKSMRSKWRAAKHAVVSGVREDYFGERGLFSATEQHAHEVKFKLQRRAAHRPSSPAPQGSLEPFRHLMGAGL